MFWIQDWDYFLFPTQTDRTNKALWFRNRMKRYKLSKVMISHFLNLWDTKELLDREKFIGQYYKSKEVQFHSCVTSYCLGAKQQLQQHFPFTLSRYFIVLYHVGKGLDCAYFCFLGPSSDFSHGESTQVPLGLVWLSVFTHKCGRPDVINYWATCPGNKSKMHKEISFLHLVCLHLGSSEQLCSGLELK